MKIRVNFGTLEISGLDKKYLNIVVKDSADYLEENGYGSRDDKYFDD